MTPQEAIKFLRETIAGCHILRDRQLKEVCEISIKSLETVDRQKDEIELLNIELQAMRGAANSYKVEVKKLRNELEETQEKLENLLCEATGGMLSKHSYTSEVMTKYAHEYVLKSCDEERTEAVKEFDELLKEDCLAYPLEKDDLTMLVDVKSYNNLLKEMAGE